MLRRRRQSASLEDQRLKGLFFTWRRPLGATDGHFRITVTESRVTTEWATPLELYELLDETRQTLRIEAVEVKGPWELVDSVSWSQICQSLKKCTAVKVQDSHILNEQQWEILFSNLPRIKSLTITNHVEIAFLKKFSGKSVESWELKIFLKDCEQAEALLVDSCINSLLRVKLALFGPPAVLDYAFRILEQNEQIESFRVQFQSCGGPGDDTLEKNWCYCDRIQSRQSYLRFMGHLNQLRSKVRWNRGPPPVSMDQVVRVLRDWYRSTHHPDLLAH